MVNVIVVLKKAIQYFPEVERRLERTSFKFFSKVQYILGFVIHNLFNGNYI
jgi:hypothetical protein